MTLLEFCLRLGFASLCGLFIGLEREWKQKNAGLRTNILVATGSAIFVMLSLKLLAEQDGDVTRIVGQVVTGIGFLGAGVIIRHGKNVRGLTTAATIWASAAVGSLTAAGFLIESLICTGLIVLVNISLAYVDDWVEKKTDKSG